jgi:hypothetical protein
VRLWRRDDDEIDDTMDADSAAIEPLVLAALASPVAWDAHVQDVQVMFDGQTRVGMLAMSFVVIRNTPEGAPLTDD